ncbi:DUF4105 domain-containing protein [Dyadobacter sp. CY323]|uniref:lipoprotein N-acyltransferase Lnb domain-containing protein n=1 Tax=Dyadobacter sp. CY323 TaxID=2907302 RepID=UPI001F1B4C32|nr:DUF4105 domain-containing protein [Dyadobacter sp. CY323]MCE6991567.1 DUF4105 domain-containing protein [Dyadobacter sp. CY323]
MKILTDMNPNYRRFVLIIALILSANLSTFAQFGTLSPETKVSLVTFGPGTELYSGFGHSVLWIYDPVQRIDRAYSYGTFSFDKGNFYVNFMRGYLPYSISVAPMAPQFEYYRSENRSIAEQVLNLSQTQKQRLFSYLETNYLPENRVYNYRFFYDNCASRLGLAVQEACGDSIIYKGYTHEKLSFRQWIDRYAYKQNPWADFGMDLALGNPADVIATPEQATFLPDNLSTAFKDARVKTANGLAPLVLSTHDYYEAEPIVYAGIFTPTVVFWALAIITLAWTYWQTSKEKVNFTFDKVLFSVVGLAGWLLALLWFATEHADTKWNYDLLWAFPFWMPAIFFISEKKKPYWFQFLLIFYGFLLLCATGNVMKHNYVVIPIILTLIIRVYYINNSLSKIPQKG